VETLWLRRLSLDRKDVLCALRKKRREEWFSLTYKKEKFIYAAIKWSQEGDCWPSERGGGTVRWSCAISKSRGEGREGGVAMLSSFFREKKSSGAVYRPMHGRREAYRGSLRRGRGALCFTCNQGIGGEG